jgi:hypothetical protein
LKNNEIAAAWELAAWYFYIFFIIKYRLASSDAEIRSLEEEYERK